jgi:hypothetical protein
MNAMTMVNEFVNLTQSQKACVERGPRWLMENKDAIELALRCREVGEGGLDECTRTYRNGDSVVEYNSGHRTMLWVGFNVLFRPGVAMSINGRPVGPQHNDLHVTTLTTERESLEAAIERARATLDALRKLEARARI